MDKTVIECLAAAGADYELKGHGLLIPIQVSDARPEKDPPSMDDRTPEPLGEEVLVLSGEIVIPRVKLKKISELFSGNRQPPDFKYGPPDEYMLFFAFIERMATDFCTTTMRVERDVEFERLYNLLRRRPDGRDFNPIFSYLQGIVRLYMSIRDVSQAEFEAVASRLARSAKTFSEGPTSKNYHDIALKNFHQ